MGVTVGALVPSLPWGSQADGGTLRRWLLPWRLVFRPHLFFSRTFALLEAQRDGKGSDTRLGAQTGGAARVAQAFCSTLLPGGGAASGVWGTTGCARRRQWHPTPVLLPGKSHGRRSLVGCSPWDRQESTMAEQLHFHFSLFLHWRRNWQPSPVFLPGESQGQGSLLGCCLWGRTESDTTEAT